MSGFFGELRRRKVYRVAAAYVVAAGFIIQVSSVVFPAWDLPSWSLRLLIALVLAGFPIVLIFAWAFDVTSEGIERTAPVEASGPHASGHRRRNVILLATAGLAVSIAAGFFILPGASARKIEKSIAVLPFESLSEDKENAHFADGMQDDILTNLSKINDLKVISRTSVMSYRGNTRNIREIGKALGVSTILEGSVRRAGNKVKVNVQLIDAATDEHLWAEDYDGDLSDVFAIQTKLAHEIAAALHAKLSPSEKAQMERRPTQNNEAYVAYQKANTYHNVPDKFREDTLLGEKYYEEAVKLDPEFAQAWAGLAQVENWMFHSYDPTPTRREKAKVAAEMAIRLQPDLPEARLALGFFYYYCDRDDQHYERALNEFETAKRRLPNCAEIYMAIGAIERRQGKWEQSTKNLERAKDLDPKNSWVLQNLGFNYLATRNFEKAIKVFDEAIAAAPQSFGGRAAKAKAALAWTGDTSVLEKMLAEVPPGVDPDGMVTYSRFNLLIFQRKLPEALRLLQEFPGTGFHGDATSAKPKAFFEGIVYLMMKEEGKGREAFQRALPMAERSVQGGPNDAGRHVQLGMILALLGEKERAIAEGKRAVELVPESTDAFDGPDFAIALAQIYSWTGEKDKALQIIERSLSIPAGITAPMLKVDPVWEPLHGDPRFQALLAKYAGP